MHCVDLGKSFPTHIFLQNLASIQRRTSPVKFARSLRTDPPGSGAACPAANQRYLYGKWENGPGNLPLLDACGGHFGITPECTSACYHYHVQDNPPFFFGCIGPNATDGLVSVAECRSKHSTECGDSVTPSTFQIYNPTTGSNECIQYKTYCPCFDNSSSNVNTVELPAITR